MIFSLPSLRFAGFAANQLRRFLPLAVSPDMLIAFCLGDSER